MYSSNSKTRIQKVVIFSLIFSMAFSPMTLFFKSANISADAAATTIEQDKNSVAGMQKQITSKKQQIAQIEKDIAAMRSSQASLAVIKGKQEEKIKLLEETIELGDEIVAASQNDMAETEKEMEELEVEYQRRYELFLLMMQTAYEEGNANYVEMIIESESFSDFLSRVDIITDMLEYNKNIIADLKASKEKAAALRQKYEEAQNQNLEYKESLKAKIAETEKEKKENEALMAKLERDLVEARKAQDIALNDMDRTQQDIKRVLDEIQKKQAAQQTAPKAYVGGELRWPVDATTVSSKYGQRINPISKRSEFHYGIDIPSPYGSNVYAANDGTVIISTYNSGYGYYVVVEHGGGMTTLYAHNSKLLVSVGDKVKRSDVIAKIGSTGFSTGNHCHFEVSVDGARQNPMNYFK